MSVFPGGLVKPAQEVSRLRKQSTSL